MGNGKRVKVGKKFKISEKIFSLILLLTTVFLVSKVKKEQQGAKNAPNFMPSSEALNSSLGQSKKEEGPDKQKVEELRAVWVPFMDLQVKDFNEENFKENYRQILKKVKAAKLNTVFVQVRPFSDALYPSKIYPWSHILTGRQGQDPGFDPLKFMLEETHKEGIKFHAWVNPMRVKNAYSPKDLHEMNPCIKWEKESSEKFKKYVVKNKDGMYYDPKYKEVREIIANGIKEIVESYNVDGINFDDYFYPANNLWVDGKNQEAEENLTDEAEKKENINLLGAECYAAVKSVNPNVQFGICPQGNFDNLKKAGVDIKTWVQNEGYVDYLCPEIYTNSENPVLPFERATLEWEKLVLNGAKNETKDIPENGAENETKYIPESGAKSETKDKKPNRVKLYLGLGLYKTGTNEYDAGTWMKYQDIIKNQIEFLRKAGYDGFSLYSSVYLDKEENKNEVQNVISILD